MKWQCVQTCFDSQKAHLYEEGIYQLDEATVRRFKSIGFIGPDEPMTDQLGKPMEPDPFFVPFQDEQRALREMSKAELRGVARAMAIEIDGQMDRESILEKVLASSEIMTESEEDVAVKMEPKAPLQIKAQKRKRDSGDAPQTQIRAESSNVDRKAKKAKPKPPKLI